MADSDVHEQEILEHALLACWQKAPPPTELENIQSWIMDDLAFELQKTNAGRLLRDKFASFGVMLFAIAIQKSSKQLATDPTAFPGLIAELAGLVFLLPFDGDLGAVRD